MSQSNNLCVSMSDSSMGTQTNEIIWTNFVQTPFPCLVREAN